MKKLKQIPKNYILLTIGILLSSVTLLFAIKNISLAILIENQPKELLVSNISTVQAKIYWKTGVDEIHNISYKEAKDTGLFKDIEDFDIYRDNVEKKRIYSVDLENLEPNTEYVFKIKENDGKWQKEYSFKTKDIGEEVSLPDMVNGEDMEMSLIVVDIEGDKYMLDTQYHGTWVFDSKGKKYTTEKYATYMSESDIQGKLLSLLNSDVIAASGANCKTGITVNNSSYKPTKSETVRIVKSWVEGCKEGGYSDECYEDTYCRSLKSGINPAFTMALWAHESGGSNYEYNSKVEDFGIHGLSSVPVRDFEKQLNHFLTLATPSYISGCTGSGSDIDKWGAKFWKGNCSSAESMASGKEYMTGISQVYNWLTNETLSWPFTVSADSGACNYSSSYTNTTYNTCTSKGTSTAPTPPSSTPTTPTTGGDGSRDFMIVTGTGVTPERRDCLDPDGCTCLYGYTNSDASSSLDINKGYSCTIDQKVIQTPPSETDICCLTNSTPSLSSASKCTGKVLENVSKEQCKLVEKKIDLKLGTNFIESEYIVDKNNTSIDSAKGLISNSSNTIIAIGSFKNDQWSNLVKFENGTIYGEDFILEPGESYLVVASGDIQIPVSVIVSDKKLEIEKLVGWNLVPSSLFKSVTQESKSILQNTKYTFISQIALWSKSKNIFEYTIRDISGQTYGESLKTSSQAGFFLKIPQ